MNNLLYTYEEVCDLIRERNLNQFEREDAEDNFLWQFAKGGPSLHVKTIMQSRYVLFASEKDFIAIRKKADAANLGIAITETKKEMIELMVSQYEEVASKAILFVKNGNKGLNADPVERALPHMILFFTNENLEFILDSLVEIEASKEESKKKPAPVVRKTPASVAFRPIVKEKVPELTDEEVRDVFPEGCAVAHAKYGKGTVTSVADGKIEVTFEDSTIKVFAANVCIGKKLLTKTA